jgi:hypothetical protein
VGACLLASCLALAGVPLALLHGFDANAAADLDANEAGEAKPSTPATPVAEAELIEQLSAIGYLAGTQPAHASKGVTLHDARRVAPGLNLMTSGHAPMALLLDSKGEVLHEWRADFTAVFPDHPKLADRKGPRRNYWRDVRLLPDGSIVVIWELFGIFKLDRDSRVVWAVPEPAHHALQISESGEIVHLQAKRMWIPGILGKRAIEDFIVVRDAGGRELRRLAMSEALANIKWPRLRDSFWKRAKGRGYPVNERSLYDPFHTNAIWLLSAAEAARLGDPFRAGDALVSMAMLDTIAIIDLEARTTRWSQQGPFGMQHEPRLSLDGDIVLFNNFVASGKSSVLTLDPRTRVVKREYTGPESAPLYSRRSGRVQVLPNGNLLVIETEGGRALEITADEEAVWEYRSPFRVGESKEKVAGLYSFQRVDARQTAWLNAEREGDYAQTGKTGP